MHYIYDSPNLSGTAYMGPSVDMWGYPDLPSYVYPDIAVGPTPGWYVDVTGYPVCMTVPPNEVAYRDMNNYVCGAEYLGTPTMAGWSDLGLAY